MSTPSAPTPATGTSMTQAMLQASQTLLGLPFDLMRAQYAAAARAGLVRRSMLASSRFDRTLSALERLSYGPFARCV